MTIERSRERALLSYLLLHANRVVSADQLVDALWGISAPKTARTQIHAAVSGIRHHMLAVNDADRILTRSGGYQISVAEHELDLTLFGRHLTDAQADARPTDAADKLRAALTLWRGPAFTGVDAAFIDAARVPLDEQRLVTFERLADLELTLGRHDALVPELAAMAHENPLRERLIERLMLALYRSGRQAEALQAARDLRRLLTEEQGLDPGRTFIELEQAILHAEPTLDLEETHAVEIGRTTPAQLPNDAADFTGREQQLEQLDGLLRGTAIRTAIGAVVGAGGVGKSTLVVRWAHRARERYPDGQLYINLRAHSTAPPIRPIEALARFLRALGVESGLVPIEVEEAAALYRTLLAGKRILVVLDDANDPDQIRPLLPAGSACTVLITSRSSLTGLVAHEGALRLELGILTATEALALLTTVLGRHRVEAESTAVARLAELCGHLPLALRIAAAQLADQPGLSVAGYVAELDQGNALSALNVDGDSATSVRATFQLSYGRLDATQRRLFRLLSLASGVDFTVEAAAALVDIAIAEARWGLDRLVAVHLLQRFTAGRYSYHDLVRQYAREQAVQEETDAARGEAQTRYCQFYLDAADTATKKLWPGTLRLPIPEPVHSPLTSAMDESAALSWLEAERANLMAVIALASAGDQPSIAWLLADTLRSFLYIHRYAADWMVAAETALAAATKYGSTRAQASAQMSLGLAHLDAHEFGKSIAHQSAALGLATEGGWLDLRDALLNNIGIPYLILGRLEQARASFAESTRSVRMNPARQAAAEGNLGLVEHFLGHTSTGRRRIAAALALHQAAGNRNGEADSHYKLGILNLDTGQLDQAIYRATTAFNILNDAGGRRFQADVQNLLGAAHLAAARHQESLDHHGRALRCGQDINDRYAIIEAQLGIAAAEMSMGDNGSALGHAEQALATARELGYRVQEGNALTALAGIRLSTGDISGARELAQRGLEIQCETGYLLGQQRARAAVNLAVEGGTRVSSR